MKALVCGLAMSFATVTMAAADAGPSVTVLKSRLDTNKRLADDELVTTVRQNLDLAAYRAVRVQVIFGADGAPDHLLVHLLAKGKHAVSFARIDVDGAYKAKSTTVDYRLTDADKRQQPGRDTAVCPDETVQFVALCPNDDDLEIATTNQVADYAQSHNLKTVRLLKTDATRAAYLNYMACPNLLGNFYDGDSDPTSMVVSDGVVSNDDFSTTLKGKFNLKTTNIWVACEAYNDPMLASVQKDAKARKYAAGINDLEVGPSDKAAACAMQAAIDGKPMTDAFKGCQQQLDSKDDNWGFGGDGTDDFWH